MLNEYCKESWRIVNIGNVFFAFQYELWAKLATWLVFFFFFVCLFETIESDKSTLLLRYKISFTFTNRKSKLSLQMQTTIYDACAMNFKKMLIKATETVNISTDVKFFWQMNKYWYSFIFKNIEFQLYFKSIVKLYVNLCSSTS